MVTSERNDGILPLAEAQRIIAKPEEESVVDEHGIYRLKPIPDSPYMRRLSELAQQEIPPTLVFE